MAQGNVTKRHHFCWYVYNTFMPYKSVQATFCTRSPTLTAWQMTLSSSRSNRSTGVILSERHLKRKLNFTLACSRFYDNPFIVVADYLKISISADGENVFEEEKIDGHIFDDRRFHAYGLSTYINPGRCHLAINVEIGLSAREDLNLNAYQKIHLRLLSRDLKRLLRKYPEYSDLLLRSSGSDRYLVHKCIIQAMGNNFSEYPESLRILGQTAEIDISNNLLYDILHFMYSGELNNWSNNSSNEMYITELFQVIDKYRLHNLYKVFISDELQQDRRTFYSCRSQDFAFVLSPSDRKRRWVSKCYSYAEVVIDFESFFHPHGHFNYSLTFTCEREESLCARVILGFEQKITDRSVFTVVHEHDFEIEGSITWTLEGCRFEGADLNLYFQQVKRLVEVEDFPHEFHFVLYLSYGGECIEILNKDGGIRRETDKEEGHKILSSQLSELLMQRTGADLEIDCRTANQSFRVHKAIFVARIPRWRRLVTPRNSDLIADRVTCDYESEFLRSLLHYCYTGKYTSAFGFLNLFRRTVYWIYRYWINEKYPPIFGLQPDDDDEYDEDEDEDDDERNWPWP